MCLTEVSYSINIMYKIYVSLKVSSSSTTLYVCTYTYMYKI